MTRARIATGAGTDRDAGIAVNVALRDVADRLRGEAVDLAVVFLGGAHADAAQIVADLVRSRLAPRTMVGVTAQGVVRDGTEVESPHAISIWAAVLPDATLTPLRYPAPGVGSGPTGAADAPGATGDAGDTGAAGATGADWPDLPDEAEALLLLADPLRFPADAFLSWVDQARSGLPVTGGLASGDGTAQGIRLLLDGSVYTDGAVGIAVSGVGLRFVVSQGCRPVGASYVITQAERNIIVELGGRPAAERIREAYEAADAVDRRLMQEGLQVGIAIDEYADRHDMGDFVIRGVIGAHPDTGAVAVTDLVDVGQTVRLQVRDARSADEDLRSLLAGMQAAPAAGGLLFTCNGRGSRLFGVQDHDAGLVSDALRGAPVAGFFAAGELGPVGPRSFLHGFTASLLVVDDAAR